MKQDIVYVIYVDDTIIAGPDVLAIKEHVTNIGITKNEQHHSFNLRDKCEVGDLLGIRIKKQTSKILIFPT